MIIKRVIRKVKYVIWFLYSQCKFRKIGKKSFISKPFFICNKKNIEIGENTFIRDFARIEPVLKWGGTNFNPLISIGNNVCIEQGIHITCANKVVIGNGCLITPYCVITDINHLYTDIYTCILLQPIECLETVIGDDCFIGSGAKIMPGVHLGKHCVVGANSVVTKSFPDYCVIAGIPAKAIKRYDISDSVWKKTKPNGDFD